jgi:hypothetical protein
MIIRHVYSRVYETHFCSKQSLTDKSLLKSLHEEDTELYKEKCTLSKQFKSSSISQRNCDCSFECRISLYMIAK